jgi:hypothetical protein
MSRCATCDQDGANPCGHLSHDPKATPEAQLAILRQSLFQQPAKPQPTPEQPETK